MSKNNSHKSWTEADLKYLEEALKKGSSIDEISKSLNRSKSAISARISRMKDDPLEDLTSEEKFQNFEKMCKYYAYNGKDCTTAEAYKQFDVPTNFFTRLIYSPSNIDLSKIKPFMKEYMHFKELFGIGSKDNKRNLSNTEMKTLEKLYCKEGRSLTSISKKMKRSHRTLTEIVNEKGWKRAEKVAKETLTNKPAVKKPVVNHLVSSEYSKEDPHKYLTVAAPLVEEFNKKIDWLAQVQKEYAECQESIAKLAKALEPLKL